MMKEIVINDKTYRLKKLNAIEIMAFKTQINFDTYEHAKELYELVLEQFETQANDKWLPVKQKDTQIYYPNGIENDFDTISQLLGYFIQYIKSVFQKSNESNSQQE